MLQTITSNYSTELSEDELVVTSSARSALTNLMEDADDDDEFKAIRVYVQGGGCGGLGYSMTFAEDATDYDSVLDCGTFKLLIDPVALSFLQGCEIDYLNEGVNTSFVFRNAFQAVGGSGTCSGCGGSGY